MVKRNEMHYSIVLGVFKKQSNKNDRLKSILFNLQNIYTNISYYYFLCIYNIITLSLNKMFFEVINLFVFKNLTA